MNFSLSLAWPLRLSAALALASALACRTPCVLVTPNQEAAELAWLGQAGPGSWSHTSQHWGALPNLGPVSLAILPMDLESVQELPDCDDCPKVKSFLAPLARPLWVPNEGSRVRLVERADEADWVLESRLVTVYVGDALTLPYPLGPNLIPERDHWAVTWYRIRDRRSGKILWACRIAPPAVSRVRWRALSAEPVHQHLEKHRGQLAVHLNAALNGSPGL